MSLATRCPACGTIFRVVQDQLKVSEGWVRCGQCHEVFHGIEALFDLDSDPALAARRASRPTAPAPAAPPARPPAPPAATVPPAPAPVPLAPAVSPPRFAAEAPVPAPTGFAPAAQAIAPAPQAAAPTPIGTPMMRRTIAPRFAARLAEESARARGTIEPGDAPTTVPAAEPPAPPIAFAPAAEERPAPHPPIFEAAPPQRQPRTLPAREPAIAPPAAEAPAIVVDDAPAPPPRQAGERPMAARVVDDEDDDGPLTLASMLPDASEWPRPAEPRPRRRAKPPAASPAPTAAAAPAPSELPPEAQAAADARFLREARREARWNKPWVRSALAVSLVLLAVAAVGQLAWPMRDTLAARYPATRPAWQMLCEQAGCTIEAPRALASLALDGSSLTRTGAEHVLLFSADLHNRSDQEVRMPFFDLTFMDMNGEIVARKVLAPEQIGITLKALAPEAELHVHARIQVGSLDASGFQAALFYP